MRLGPPIVLVLGALVAWPPASATSRARAGLVDLEPTARSSSPLELLAGKERFVEALELAIAQLEGAHRVGGHDSRQTLLALHRVGAIAHLSGDQATAEDVLAAVLEARRAVLPPEDPAIVETLLQRGRAARYRGDRDRARACYDEATRLLATQPGRHPVLEGELLQREADWARGRDEAGSIALYEGALASRKATLSEPSFAIADNETWLAWTLARLGRRAEAERYARDASRQLDALGYADHSLRGTLDILRADTLTLSGHAAEAETLYGAAAERFRKIRQRQGGGYIRRSFPLDGYDSLALAALRRGDGEQAWRLIERSRAATHVDFASLGLWKRQDPAGFEAWTADRRALDRVRKRLTPLHGGPRWTASTAQGFLEMLRLRARISREEDRYLDAFRPAIPSLERVQETLGPQQALVGWLEVRVGGTPSESFMAERSDGYAYVVRPSGPVRWVPLWKTRSSIEEARLVGAWGHAFGRLTRAASWPTRVGADSELDAQLRAWGRVHVDPILPLLEGVDHLVLERLSDPIELAVLPDGRLLGDAFDVSYVPSALALVLLADVPTDEGASRARSALTVAGPTDTLADARVDQLVGSADAPSDHRGGGPRTAAARRLSTAFRGFATRGSRRGPWRRCSTTRGSWVVTTQPRPSRSSRRRTAWPATTSCTSRPTR